MKDPMTRDFYVVGGPVQPDRECYVVRKADGELLDALKKNLSCYVLGPRQMGKSSLMAGAAAALRRLGRQVSVVDLTQIGQPDRGPDPGRWFYSLAYRICRDLRLKVELHHWWQDRASLAPAQRLAEFFGDIVLAGTQSPVVVFFDEIECTEDLQYREDFYAALRTCMNARATEPDYERLTFVLLGVTSARRLVSDQNLGPFSISREIRMADFTLEETLRLAAGLGGSERSGRRLLARVYHWTAGQPYLTQKLCRALARMARLPRNDAQLDEFVHRRLLAPQVSQDEPLLSHIRSRLLAGNKQAAQALKIYGRVRRGMRVVFDPDSPAHERLLLLGVLVESDRGLLRIRNPIYETVFSARWASQSLPVDWRNVSLAAAAVVLAVALPVWYTQILPRPYIETLSAVVDDEAVALEAYRNLRSLPGFGATADRLMADVLERRSQHAEDFQTVKQADRALRAMPGQTERADGLLADFWMRQVDRYRRAEDRDRALMSAMQASSSVENIGAADAGQLVGEDYPLLQRTIRLERPLDTWRMDGSGNRLVVVTGSELQTFELDAVSPAAGSFTPTGLAFATVQRELMVEEAGDAGNPSVTAVVDHGDPSQLRLALVAPDGRRTPLELETAEGETLRYRARLAPETARAPRRGRWRLEVTDAVRGVTGRLVSWSLRFGRGDVWQDAAGSPLQLPDPRETGQVHLVLSDSGDLVAAVPDETVADGAIVVWSVAAKRREAVIDRPAGTLQAALVADGGRLVLRSARELSIYDAYDGHRLARLSLTATPGADLAVSGDGRALALVEQPGAGEGRVVTLAAGDGRVIAQAPLATPVTAAAVNGDGSLLAVAGEDRTVRLLGLGDGADEIASFRSEARVSMLTLGPGGHWLMSLDEAGDLSVHATSPSSRPLLQVADVAGALPSGPPVALGPRGELVALSFAGGRVKIVSTTAEGRVPEPVLRHGERFASTRFARNRQWVATAGERYIRLWRLVDRGEPQPGPLRTYSAAALAAQQGQVLLGTWTGQVRLGQSSAPAEDRRAALDYFGHTGPVTALAQSPDASMVASGGANGVIRLWRGTGGEPLPRMLRHPAGAVRSLQFSPGGTYLLSLGRFAARLWDMGAAAEIAELAVAGVPTTGAFAPDGQRMAVGDSAGNVNVWHVGAQRPDRVMRIPGAVDCVQFFEAGGQPALAAAEASGTVYAWRLADGSPLGEPLRLAGAVRQLVAVPQQHALFAVTDDWLHRIDVSAAGLAHRSAALLPAAIVPGSMVYLPENGGRLAALSDDPTNPMPLLLTSGDRDGRPGDGSRRDLAGWQRALGLLPTPEGTWAAQR